MSQLGLFVTFEGIEGCGKSTQVARLAAQLTNAGLEVVTTREPGGTALGRRLRALLLDPATSVEPWPELLLYTADRCQHLAEVIEPALARGAVVLCDRYADATRAYQGYGRGLDLSRIDALHRDPPLDRKPHGTVVLDLDPEIALERARARNAAQDGADEGRFEEERLEFHHRVRDGYLALAAREPDRFRVIDARGAADDVALRIREALVPPLPRTATGS